MMNFQNKVIFYSFVVFIIFMIGASLFIERDSLFAVSVNGNPEKNQTLADENIKKIESLPTEIAPQERFMAPDFTFPDLNGKPVSLSQFKGKVVFLNIWATWCGPCRIEMPAMEKLYRKFRKEDFVILAVSIDRMGKLVVGPFKEEMGITFPILLSPKGRIQSTYMVRALPSSFIIDKTGRIAARVTGAADWFGTETVETFEYLIHKT